MKSFRAPIVALSLAGLAVVGRPARCGEDADLAARVRSAANALLASSTTADADRMKPMTEVVGLLSQVAVRGQLPDDVRARLADAAARLRKGTSPFADPGVEQALNGAYAALHGGRRFTFPSGIRGIDQARDASQRAIDGAAAALEAGRHEEATKDLLQFLMLLTTPMEAH
jgi:hypothetical protein